MSYQTLDREGWITPESSPSRQGRRSNSAGEIGTAISAQPGPVARHGHDESERTGVDGHFEVLTMGRVGVDLYPLQESVGLEDVDTFSKSVGGSAGNDEKEAAK